MESRHIVGKFDRDLGKIQTRIVDMGQLVLAQLGEATAVLATAGEAKITEIIATDKKINGMNRKIANRAERLITLRQPMVQDLRAALSAINIASELERIGDHAKTTAKRARALGVNALPPQSHVILSQMNGIIQKQLQMVLDAYINDDAALSEQVLAGDKAIDALNNDLFALSLKEVTGAELGEAENLMNAVLISRNFERVGDHVVNMARHIYYISTGDTL